MRPYLENTYHKKGLEEWIKVKALNSSPSTANKQKKDLTLVELQVVRKKE
jgi:hypothetical protein